METTVRTFGDLKVGDVIYRMSDDGKFEFTENRIIAINGDRDDRLYFTFEGGYFTESRDEDGDLNYDYENTVYAEHYELGLFAIDGGYIISDLNAFLDDIKKDLEELKIKNRKRENNYETAIFNCKSFMDKCGIAQCSEASTEGVSSN
jgi:hypothetical protein